MPIVWRHFRCTLTHLPIVKPCYDNQRVSLYAYVNKLLLCRCKVICAAIHSLQLSAASECPCMKKSCNILSAFLRCKSYKVNPFLAHCHALGWTPSETMTGGAPEVRSNKSLTLLTFGIWYLIFDIWNLTYDIWHLTLDIQPMDHWTNGAMDQ